MSKSVNERIVDRNDVFYWQAERRITEAEAAEIWKDKDSNIKNADLLKAVNKILAGGGLNCLSIDEVDKSKQESEGGVNSTRVGHLDNGEDVLIRCHPRGVKNGYFHVESLAADLLNKNKLPSYKTYAIKDCTSKKDCAFQIIEKINGTVVVRYLKQHPEKENKIVFEMGKTIAKANKIKVNGFGPFDNELAKKGELRGLHNSLADSMNAGLDFDLKTLKDYGLLTEEQCVRIKHLFSKNNPLLKCKQSVFVHNDFADWNMLTDGETINGIIDLDECVGGDPMCEIGCWSLFFKPERLEEFLNGYFTVAKKPKNFEDKLELFRLRYSLTKMTLRVRRYTYDKSENFKKLIDIGKVHLQKSAEYFQVW